MPYTGLFITINTNKAGKTQAEVDYLVTKLKRFIQHDLAIIENWRPLIRIEPGFEKVRHIRIMSPAIQTGPRQHLIHIHMNVLIEHYGKIAYKGTQRKWQDFVNSRLGLGRTSYVEIKLTNTRALNYAVKSQKKKANTGVFYK